jgi:hypothetical protein
VAGGEAAREPQRLTGLLARLLERGRREAVAQAAAARGAALRVAEGGLGSVGGMATDLTAAAGGLLAQVGGGGRGGGGREPFRSAAEDIVVRKGCRWASARKPPRVTP